MQIFKIKEVRFLFELKEEELEEEDKEVEEDKEEEDDKEDLFEKLENKLLL